MAKGDMIALTRKEVFSQIMWMSDTPRQFGGTGPNAGKDYWTGRCRGLGFTAMADFYELHKAGKISEVTFIEGEYTRERDDPQRAGEKITETLASYNISGFVTNEQLREFEEQDAKLASIKSSIAFKIKMEQMKEIKALDMGEALDESTLRNLLQAV
jgi:hypothetical protein